MSHHIKDQDFLSDKYDWCPSGFMALKFSDPVARMALKVYAENTQDQELAEDILSVIKYYEE